MSNNDLDEWVRDTRLERRFVDRPPLVDDVHDALVDMLMNRRLDASDRLNIDAVARTLGVSPTPVREALVRMEAEGLVVKEPRRGYTVTPLIDLDDLRALIDFRLLIEPAAAAAAAERVTPAEASALRTLASSGGSGEHDDTSNRRDMIYDATFHSMVANLGGNRWLSESLGRLRSHLHMYRLYHHAQAAAATRPEHVAIARAIAKRDPDAAAEAMRIHLHSAIKRLEDVFASGRIPPPR